MFFLHYIITGAITVAALLTGTCGKEKEETNVNAPKKEMTMEKGHTQGKISEKE